MNYKEFSADATNKILEELQQLKDLEDLPYGVFETELQILMFFIFKVLSKDLSTEPLLSVEKYQLAIYNDIISKKLAEVNQLFDIDKLQFGNIVSTRLKLYEDLLKGKIFKGPQIQNKEKEDKIIYAASFIFYILYADKNVFENSTKPFANGAEIKKQTIIII